MIQTLVGKVEGSGLTMVQTLIGTQREAKGPLARW